MNNAVLFVAEREVPVGSKLGRQFGWLWAAYIASTGGTWLAFDAVPIIAILVLHAEASQVAWLAAVGLAAGALVAVPLGPWVEFRRKQPVMVAMDLIRFVALLSIPAAASCGLLSLRQLLAVSVVVAAADVTFTAASGAYLKTLLPPAHLLTANARFESTRWTATIIGPPVGGAALGVFGSASTVLANAVSFLLSAAAIAAIGGDEPRPAARASAQRRRGRDLLAGWHVITSHASLRLLLPTPFWSTASSCRPCRC